MTRNAQTLTLLNNKPQSNLVTATIADAERLDTYTLILEGKALEPKYLDGDLLTIATNALPALSGDAVIVRVKGRHGAMFLNSDGDAWDVNGGFLERGSYEIVGIVIDRKPVDQQIESRFK